MQRPRLFTAHAASVELQVDRRTLQRALVLTPPDSVTKSAKPLWTIATASAALERHRAANPRSTVAAPDPNAAVYPQLRSLAERIEAALTQRDRAGDAATRLRLSLEAGAMIGELDETMQRAAEKLPAAEREVAEAMASATIGVAAAALLGGMTENELLAAANMRDGGAA